MKNDKKFFLKQKWFAFTWDSAYFWCFSLCSLIGLEGSLCFLRDNFHPTGSCQHLSLCHITLILSILEFQINIQYIFVVSGFLHWTKSFFLHSIMLYCAFALYDFVLLTSIPSYEHAFIVCHIHVWSCHLWMTISCIFS